MNWFKEEMDKALAYSEKLLEKYKQELKRAPEGKLVCQKNRNSTQFLLITDKNGEKIRKGVNNDELIKRQMARKEFAKKSIKVLQHDIKVLNRARKSQVSFDPEEILHSMTKAYALLPEEYFFDRKTLISSMDLTEADQVRINRHKEWGDSPYKESMYHAEQKTKMTSRGTYVRSKSELLIIESLYDLDIPQHYDEEHMINGVFIVPDFTFKDKNGNLFFWEYMGMMDDPYYAKRNIKKLGDYYRAGIIPGVNLIVTFDRGDNMNMMMTKAIIRSEVIPRL